MPVIGTSEVELGDQFESLPVVDRDPEGEERPFLDAYDTSSLAKGAAVLSMVTDAGDELTVPDSSRDELDSFLSRLLFKAVVDLGDGETERVDTDFESEEFVETASAAMAAILDDDSNARALNDLAVGLFGAAPWRAAFDETDLGQGSAIASGAQLRDGAAFLLIRGGETFPGDRALTINAAFINSLQTDGELDPAAMQRLEALVADSPADVTGGALLAHLLMREDGVRGLEPALEIAETLASDPSTEAAGKVLAGDLYLSAADLHRPRSPFTARSLVVDALAAYDTAIELSGDPGALAGRALALDLLGHRAEAEAAQREAVRLSPDSATWLLNLGQLEACRERFDLSLSSADSSLDLADGELFATLPETRFWLTNPGLAGYGGYSVGSDSVFNASTIITTGGGAVLITVDPFPRPPSCMTRGLSADEIATAATEEVLLASIVADDRAAADDAMERWRSFPTIDEEAEGPGDLVEPVPKSVYSMIQALDGGSTAFETDPIPGFASVAWRLPPDIQTRVCADLASTLDPDDIYGQDELYACAAEGAFRGGEDQKAADLIEHVVRLDDPDHSTQGNLALVAGILSERAGNLDDARTRYEAAATHLDTMILGLSHLGDLDLLEGDALGAIDVYSLAIAAIRTQTLGDEDFFIEDTVGPLLQQNIESNRGIALLTAAASTPGGRPDCAAHADRCNEASAAFDAAIAGDPANPIYLTNTAWAARLTGDLPRAEELLREALEKGTPLGVSVYNDLGVLAARAGRLEEATSAFEQALSIDPAYALAHWNLGILEARSGGLNLLAGQGELATAARLKGQLKSANLAFQPDEEIHRVEVTSTGRLILLDAPGGAAATGAVAFGAVATAGAIGRFISGLGAPVKDATKSVAREVLVAKRRPRLRAAGRVRLLLRRARVRWHSGFVWLAPLLVLVITTAWVASGTSPDAAVGGAALGLIAATLAIVVHVSGHLVAGGWLAARLQPARWDPGIVAAIAGAPFGIAAGPYLPDRLVASDARVAWWASLAGVLANFGAAAIAAAIYVATPMPFLRGLIATQLAVAAFALIPSAPLDGDRLAKRPIAAAMLSFASAVAALALATGVI
jgi:tetratricopeptide (TPR) repeat protein